MVTLKFIFAVALAIFDSARGAAVEQKALHSTEICYTTLGKQSVKDVLTSSYTVTSTAIKTIVVHAQSTTTVTPAAVTTTATAVSTEVKVDSAGKETGTATVMKTVMDTVTQTNTVRATTTRTVTITKTAHSTKTSTVPTSSGFVPVSSSLPGSNKVARDLTQAPKLERSDKQFSKQEKHPQNVLCKVIEVVTDTVTSTAIGAEETVTAATLTAIHTTTQITTAITTIHPLAAAHVTSTVSGTKTITVVQSAKDTTVTVTKTTTTTDVTPGPTVYAACSKQNLMPSFQGKELTGIIMLSAISSDNNQLSVTTHPPGLLSCCVACQEAPNLCTVANLLPDDPEICLIAVNNNEVCVPQKDSLYQIASCGGPPGNGSGILNGNCGEFTEFTIVDCDG